MNFEFLTSMRFWKMGIIGFVTGLEVGYPGNPVIIALATMIQVWFGGSVLINTTDRFNTEKEYNGEAM